MIGQRFELQGKYEGMPLENKFGICVAVNNFNASPTYLMIIEDCEWGHDGYDTVPDEFQDLLTGKNCWWVGRENIKELNDPSPQAKRAAIINKIKYLDKKFKERKHHVTG